MVTNENLGEFVEYYDEGGRYGFLLEVKLYGKPKKVKIKKTKGTIEDIEERLGVGVIRPYGTKHGEGTHIIEIALEKITPVDPAYKKKVAEQEAALKKELLGALPPLVALFG